MTNFVVRQYYSRGAPPPVGVVNLGEESLTIPVQAKFGLTRNFGASVETFVGARGGFERNISGGVQTVKLGGIGSLNRTRSLNGGTTGVGFRKYTGIDDSWPVGPLPDKPWTEIFRSTGTFSLETNPRED